MRDLAEWYRSGGKRGRAFPEQGLIQLAFELGKTIDELYAADETWIHQMLIDRHARALASVPGDYEYHRRIYELTATTILENGNANDSSFQTPKRARS